LITKTPATSADVVEPEHYKRSVMNSDVSREESPMPLREETPEESGVLSNLKHSYLADVEFEKKKLSDFEIWPQ
jgi:hypothetical protein